MTTFAQRRPGREPRRHQPPDLHRPTRIHAQRRPGREPRRHMGDRTRRTLPPGRSTKAGARTPATPASQSMACAAVCAQRRPGREPRRHARPPVRLRRRRCALNEGRGANPGDTRVALRISATASAAQRRPGREPRRHAGAGRRAVSHTRAQRRPGREPRRHFTSSARRGDPPCRYAQRRPGREPRRHAHGRSARTPRCRPLNEGRGANPGDT